MSGRKSAVGILHGSKSKHRKTLFIKGPIPMARDLAQCLGALTGLNSMDASGDPLQC